jgi:glycerol uptake facilitator-like aquaporin
VTRPVAAEFLGSVLLFAAVIGSGIMADGLSPANPGVALLGNTPATVAMLALLIVTLGPVSGAQFNPAVTLVDALDRPAGRCRALPVLAAQLAAAPVAVVVAHAMFGLPLLQASARVRATPGEWLGEAVATLVLLFAIHATLRVRPALVALTVPAAIAAGYWWTSSTSFANPAITLARTMTDSFSGIRAIDAPAFVIAQLVGAVIGWRASCLLLPANSSPARSGC